ncbi:DUF998 domain-containing protein [Actinokineospora enzanensis]|uniref:DUF998 domain-containing protein n=1 Tax=Actinokineospora enzanensis TaxID=155975 RepID=UPI0003702250|nr:DUF998 domain-containing protein [Actinokineospora enzanensis]
MVTSPECFDRTAATTRSLLGYGVLSGAFYLVTGLIQALTRDGYEITRHELSLLSDGPLGWIQITNFVLSGLMVLAAAVGIRRALRDRWGSLLVAGYGVGLIGAGVFVADPMNGFPLGTPAGRPVDPSWHGTLHMIVGGAGFLCLIAATFVLARRSGSVWYSRGTGVVYLAGFAGIASGVDNAAVVLGFWVAVIAGWAWLAVLSIRLYRTVPRPDGAR